MSDATEAGQAAPDATIETAPPAATPDNVVAPVETTQDQPDVKTEAEAKTFTQSEVDAIVSKNKAKAEAIAERRALKAYRETLERFAPPQQPKTEAEASGRPTQAQFENVDDYVEAMADWKMGQREQTAQQAQQAKQEQAMAVKTENFYSEAQKIHGFDRELFDELPLTRHIAEALIDSDAPAKLMAHMAAHPDEVARIAGLSPARQAAEIGKLETRLASVPRVSSAPEPIKPIGSRGSAANTDTSRMSMEEYAAKRKADGAPWARR